MSSEHKLSRREFGLGAGVAAAGAVIGAGIAPAAQAHRQRHRGKRPNVLVIIADDMGFDLGSYGHPEIETPNLDKLAKEGARLTQAYSNGNVCSPTRVSWITGRYPGRLAAGNAEVLLSQHIERRGVSGPESVLPQALKKAGYDTALYGKWHLGYPPNYSPVVSGFDEFWGVLDGGADYLTHAATGPTPASFGLYAGDPSVDAPGHVESVEEEGYLTDLIGDKAVGYLERRAGNDDPFYMGVHFTAPHWPWEDRDDKAESDRLNDPANWNGGFSLFHFDGGSLEKYYEMVRIMDENIGRILRALRRSGNAENTLVIFTSDNGGERFSYNWPFSGLKASLSEGGIRVPAIVRWPGHVRPGTVSDQVAATMDITASVLAAAGADTEQSIDGKDILPVLTGDRRRFERKLFWRSVGQQPAPQPHRAMRDGDLKYMRTPAGVESLFDLAEDPREQANLARLRPDDLARLRAQWVSWNSELVPYS